MFLSAAGKDAWLPFMALFHVFANGGAAGSGKCAGVMQQWLQGRTQWRGLVPPSAEISHWHHFCPFSGALTREAALMVASVKMNKIREQAMKEVESSLPWKIISLE